MTDPNQPPNPYQGQPNQGQPYGAPGAYPYQPPKKSHTLRNVLLILGVLGVLFCGGCLAVTGAFVNEVDKAVEEEEKNDAPTVIQEGEAFEHDGYKVDAGWKVGKDALDDMDITGMSATNTGDEGRRSALLDITFLKGTTVVASVTCSSQELDKGQSSKLDCSSFDDYTTEYDTIKVADAF